MSKFCSDLVGYEDNKSFAISSTWESARVPKMHLCIKDKCVAYGNGYCHKWNTVIEPDETKKAEYSEKIKRQKEVKDDVN